MNRDELEGKAEALKSKVNKRPVRSRGILTCTPKASLMKSQERPSQPWAALHASLAKRIEHVGNAIKK